MLVLASQSPRRREILERAGVRFTVRAGSAVDETPRPGEAAETYVVRLACEKAAAVPRSAGEVILGADTTVVVDGSILGKPEDAAGATLMLRQLSGRAHEVITGICLRSDAGAATDLATTRVWFSALSDAQIAAYVSSGEPMDKAGAYGIQGLASKFIPRIEGCYFNVVGLPVSLVVDLLARYPCGGSGGDGASARP